MTLSRRNLLGGALLGAGFWGLKSVATGLPTSFLRGGIAHASPAGEPSFLIVSSSTAGDPFNAICPGIDAPSVVFNPDARMEREEVMLGSTGHLAPKIWNDLPDAMRARMSFIHHRTYTNAHGEHARVIEGHGAYRSLDGRRAETLPSLIAQENAERLGTILKEPIRVGGPGLSYDNRPLDSVEPSELKELFPQADELGKTLQSLRDQTLDNMYADLKANGTRGARTFLDQYALGSAQARQIGDDLTPLLERLPYQKRNDPNDEIISAVALFKLKITPVVSMKLSFGGDSHRDPGFERETEQSIESMKTLALLWQELEAADLTEKVTFATLNGMGRTLHRNDGRDHNGAHTTMMVMGPRVRAGVVGGVEFDNSTDGTEPLRLIRKPVAREAVSKPERHSRQQVRRWLPPVASTTKDSARDSTTGKLSPPLYSDHLRSNRPSPDRLEIGSALIIKNSSRWEHHLNALRARKAHVDIDLTLVPRNDE